MVPGHVFVVRAALETVDADAVVVPTDGDFSVRSTWRAVLPDEPDRLRPDGWGVGQTLPAKADTAAGRPDVWFIDAALHRDETVQSVIDKIGRGVRTVIEANKNEPRRANHPRRVAALPTLGVGGGGLDAHRGGQIDALLTACREAANEAGVDVVIAAYTAADYAAFQHQRRRSGDDLPEPLGEAARALAERVGRRELALFLGAGVSMSAGLPSWGGLMKDLAAGIGVNPEEQKDLGYLDLAELISRTNKDFRAEIVEQIGVADKPGLSHLLLAGLGCEEVVTSNFDVLYEKAAERTRSEAVAVLPWEPLDARRPWALKMHGDVNHPDQIVLTRRDFVRYDAASGPAGAVVQALLMSRHLLVVGASLTDDNFLRLAHEVEHFLESNGSERRTLGTVIAFRPNPGREKLFDGVFDYIDVHRAAPDNQGRAISLFLDALALYASQDRSYFLDDRYRALVPESESPLFDEVKGLAERVREAATRQPNSGWATLADALAALGAFRGRPGIGDSRSAR